MAARTKLLEKSFPTDSCDSCDHQYSTTIDDVYEDMALTTPQHARTYWGGGGDAKRHEQDSTLSSEAAAFAQQEREARNEQDIDSLLRWLKTLPYSNTMAPSLNIEDETREFNQRAMNVQKALRLYSLLLSQLQSHISALNEISGSQGEMKQKTTTMAIAGSAGAVGALSGVAAVVGIVLAPLTLGATLALTAAAVGAGLVSAGVGGGVGAKAFIARKKCMGRKKMEKIVQDYRDCIADVECCVALIQSGMGELRRHDLHRLQKAGAQAEALKMAELSQTMYDATAHAGGTSAERLLQSFAEEMDLYFKERGKLRLTKSAKNKKKTFMSKVHVLAQDLQAVLDEQIKMAEKFSIVLD